MKKVFCIVFCFMILIHTVCAQDSVDSNNSYHFCSSLYFSDSMAIGKIANYNKCSLGHGVMAGFEFAQFPLTLNLRVEFANNYSTSEKAINSWNHFFTAIGASWNFDILSFINVKPEFDIGLVKNLISFTSEGDKTYYDTVIQIACQVEFFSEKMKDSGISLILTPFYRLLLEQSYLGQYMGLQTGIFFIF